MSLHRENLGLVCPQHHLRSESLRHRQSHSASSLVRAPPGAASQTRVPSVNSLYQDVSLFDLSSVVVRPILSSSAYIHPVILANVHRDHEHEPRLVRRDKTFLDSVAHRHSFDTRMPDTCGYGWTAEMFQAVRIKRPKRYSGHNDLRRRAYH